MSNIYIYGGIILGFIIMLTICEYIKFSPPKHRHIKYTTTSPKRIKRGRRVYRNHEAPIIPQDTKKFLSKLLLDTDVRQHLEIVCTNALESTGDIASCLNDQYEIMPDDIKLPIFEMYMAIRANWQTGMDPDKFISQIVESCLN